METSFYEKYLGTTPEQVFKFFSVNDNLEKTLKENYLWLSKPTDFNDPFDCNDNLVSFNIKEKDIENFVKTHFPGRRQEKRKEIRLHKKQPESFKNALKSSLSDIIKEQGICCFSRTYKNILMWSHYADRHKGICIGFNPRKSKTINLILHVSYEQDFRTVEYFSEKEEALMSMMITKSIDWQYEEEMRIIKDYNGRLPFEKECVQQIIFGCRTLDSDKKQIKELINNNGYNNVLFQQATMSKTSFSLDFEK